MHSLTTRNEADRYRRQRLLTVPTPPPPVVPYYDQPLYKLAKKLLRWVCVLLGLLILGTALYPPGEPTRPLRLTEEQPAPVSRAAWYESDYTE